MEESQFARQRRIVSGGVPRQLKQFLFVMYLKVSIEEEGDEDGTFETTSQVEEGESPRITNTHQDTERAS